MAADVTNIIPEAIVRGEGGRGGTQRKTKGNASSSRSVCGGYTNYLTKRRRMRSMRWWWNEKKGEKESEYGSKR